MFINKASWYLGETGGGFTPVFISIQITWTEAMTYEPELEYLSSVSEEMLKHALFLCLPQESHFIRKDQVLSL